MPLSALAVENAKPKKKPYTLSDGHGLHLLITPSGGNSGVCSKYQLCYVRRCGSKNGGDCCERLERPRR